MKENTIFVGLDVHKNSIDIALADSKADIEEKSITITTTTTAPLTTI
jgi:hypothetical protein